MLQCQVGSCCLKSNRSRKNQFLSLEGEVKLKIAEGTQSGRMLRLAGKGVQGVRSRNVGDLMCRVKVETPVKLNAEQKATLQTFAEQMAADKISHSPQSSSWVDAVKRFFKN